MPLQNYEAKGMCSDNGAQFVSDNTITVCISLEHLKLVKYNIKIKHTTETGKTMTLKAMKWHFLKVIFTRRVHHISQNINLRRLLCIVNCLCDISALSNLKFCKNIFLDHFHPFPRKFWAFRSQLSVNWIKCSR